MGNFVDDLLKLNEYTSAILGVQEDDRITMSSNLGFRINGGDATGLNLRESVLDVVDLQTDVVHASTGILNEIVSDGALLSKWFQ